MAGSSSKYRLVGGGCRPSEVQSAGMPAGNMFSSLLIHSSLPDSVHAMTCL